MCYPPLCPFHHNTADPTRCLSLYQFKMPELPKASETELDEEDVSATPFIGSMKPKESRVISAPPPAKPANPVDVTMEDIIPKLDGSNVADLVLLSMVSGRFEEVTVPIIASIEYTQFPDSVMYSIIQASTLQKRSLYLS